MRLLAVIGPKWLDVRNENGDRRLDNPDDFVRIEITTAGAGMCQLPTLAGSRTRRHRMAANRVVGAHDLSYGDGSVALPCDVGRHTKPPWTRLRMWYFSMSFVVSTRQF